MTDLDFEQISVQIALAQGRLDAIREEISTVRGLIRRLEKQQSKAEAAEAARAELFVMSILKQNEADGVKLSLNQAVERALKTCGPRDAIAIRKVFAALPYQTKIEPSQAVQQASEPVRSTQPERLANLPGQLPVGLPSRSQEQK
jgi:hypothetical protein